MRAKVKFTVKNAVCKSLRRLHTAFLTVNLALAHTSGAALRVHGPSIFGPISSLMLSDVHTMDCGLCMHPWSCSTDSPCCSCVSCRVTATLEVGSSGFFEGSDELRVEFSVNGTVDASKTVARNATALNSTETVRVRSYRNLRVLCVAGKTQRKLSHILQEITLFFFVCYDRYENAPQSLS